MEGPQASPERGDGAPQFSPRVSALLAWVLLGALAALDLVTPLGVVFPALYGVPVALSAWVKSLRFLWTLTITACVLTVAASPLHHLFFAGDSSFAWVNRSLCLLELPLLAAVLHLWITGHHRSQRERRSLEETNEELEQREEEILRQNEELQSQSEELERQSEELRVVNEELAHRERSLEQLLELARSLTSELTRDKVLEKICESLGSLTHGTTAILEKDGEDLRVRCHYGFGPEGPECDRMPVAGTFASLILSLGQTGYLEDLQNRPDLAVCRPKGGQPFRSVLSSPLRVHGRTSGVIETYCPVPHTWREGEVTLIESLAAQTSISLQSAELVEEVHQERRRFEAAFRTMPFGMALADDPEGNRVRLNPAGAALLNVARDENVSLSSPAGARLRRFVFRSGVQLRPEELPLQRALRGEEVQGEELDMAFPGGRVLHLLVSAAPIYGQRDRVVGALAGFADISAQKRLLRELDLRRREAEEASVRKTRFLAAVSHDIRTPANAINLMAEVIRRSSENPALLGRVPEMAQKLQTNVSAMMDLVGDLLDVARFDSGQVGLVESEFPLNDLMEGECRQLQPLAQEKGLKLDCRVPERPIWLHTDRVKLGRVLGNLIGNAIKFTAKGEVRVHASLQPDVERRVLIRVIDTGVGIPPEHLSHIFDEFTQLRNPERDRAKGSGLGLAISKRLVTLMGGSIEVESAPGKGSTFTVVLPASSVALRIESVQPPPVPGDQEPLTEPLGLQILLVEDHGASREGIVRLLLDEGAQVCEAPDAGSGLEQLRKDRFDAVLLDMMLPDMDGREVLRVLQRERPPGLRAIIVLTADVTPERQEEIRSLGGEFLVRKPVDVDNLLRILRDVAHQRS